MSRLLTLTLLVCIAHVALTREVPPRPESRIVGGNDATIAKHPHQVSVRHKSCSACAYQHICGGSIYNEFHIITAAHCVNNLLEHDLVVVAGTDNRNGADGVVARVANVVMHEHYNASITDNDIALLVLDTPLTYNDITIMPVPLASQSPMAGLRAVATGWGTTSEGGQMSVKLREVEVRVVAATSCKTAYGEERITENMLCAGTTGGGQDACKYDSGGPLLVNRELVGVISWGLGCARPDHPGVYVNVAHLRAWIETNGKEKSRFL